MAFDIKLSKICLILVGSPINSEAWSISNLSCKVLLLSFSEESNISMQSLARSMILKGISSSSKLPDSIFEKSSMSLITASNACPE